MTTMFRNLDRVGYGPTMAGAYGPQLVGYAPPAYVGAPYGPQLVGAAPSMMALPGAWGRRPAMAPYVHPAAYGPNVYQAPHPAAYGMGQPAIVHNPPTQVREFIIGFGPTVVNANSTAVFTAQPQLIFRGSRLIIPSTIANNFSVNDIRVGKDSQAVSANPIPAAAFSELGVGVALGLDTATPGILITLSVANTTGGNQTFSAALIGTSMQ